MTQPDRLTLVLRAVEGGSLDHVLPFAKVGAHVSAGRGLAVIAGVSQGDLQADLQQQAELHYQALGCHPLLAARTREMLNLLRLIDIKCGGLDALLAHSIEPAEELWQESREAMEAIRPLLDTLAPALVEDKDTAFSIDEHVRLAADAKRYRWLRDEALSTGSGFTPAVFDRATGVGVAVARTGDDLDQRIDSAIRNLTEQDNWSQQP